MQSKECAVDNLFRNSVNDVRKLSTCLGKQVTAATTAFREVTISGREQRPSTKISKRHTSATVLQCYSSKMGITKPKKNSISIYLYIIIYRYIDIEVKIGLWSHKK